MENSGSCAPRRSEVEAAALDVWLTFLGCADPANDAAFEGLCTLHPELVEELRKLRTRAREADDRAPTSPGGLVHPLEERLRQLAKPIVRETRFQREGVIARGGMGVIHRVRDGELDRTLALKEMILGPAQLHALAAARFLEEAQVTAQLDHPGIVPVHDVGMGAEGRIYFAMKLVRGRDLRTILDLAREGRESWAQPRMLGVLLKVCEAMSYAHSKGVIHRDLKPGNVMVGSFGEVYVMDWGLARVIGRPDAHDIRLRTEPSAGPVVETDRSRERTLAPDSPLLTMDGHVVGTPAYMSPEQARGETEKVGPRSDVYSIGAMLYHVLACRMPYLETEGRVGKHSMLARVLAGAPESLHVLCPDVPAELAAICEKAMRREPELRYADTMELAEDLRAYLEGRVVRAYETGAFAELRKWIRRNSRLAGAIAGGIVVLIAGLVSSLILKSQSDHNAVLASEREQEARDNLTLAEERRTLAEGNEQEARRQAEIARLNEEEARARRDEVLRLSAIQRLRKLVVWADNLWPAHPALLDEYDRWLAEAQELVAGLEPSPDGRDKGHRARLEELRKRALPQSDEERSAERLGHPKASELDDLKKKVAATERARAIREGREPWIEPEPISVPEGMTAARLNEQARPLVARNRTTFGEEARGLVLAQMAFDRAESPAEIATIANTLACALFACGLDEEALEIFRTVLESTPTEGAAVLRENMSRLERAIELARSGEDLAVLERRRSELDAEIETRRNWRFASDSDAWWHDQLDQLVSAITAFADADEGLIQGVSEEHGWGIQRRRDSAERIAEGTLHGPEAARLWREAIEAITNPDVCPVYGGLGLEPQVGLLPLGPDRASGLWEFAHLETGVLPRRDEAGKLVLTEETALVLVLLPGGTFAMGAQSKNPSERNYDPRAQSAESPVHEVTVAPFFLSKYEMTQGQWLRFTGRNPSFFGPRNYSPNWNRAQRMAGLIHPVEQVSWNDCHLICARLGLALPTEAQWEFAARAGTTTIWWFGNEEALLPETANISDGYAMTHEASFKDYEAALDDGNTVHAPVGSYAANAFGLHDVIGNVLEWCLDSYDPDFYWRSPRTDPLNDARDTPYRIFRGGAFNSTTELARTAFRPGFGTAEIAIREMGLRPARTITHAAPGTGR